MLANLTPFLLHWALTALGLWVASHVFKGMRFDNGGALVIAALLLGLANAVVRPLLGKLGSDENLYRRCGDNRSSPTLRTARHRPCSPTSPLFCCTGR